MPHGPHHLLPRRVDQGHLANGQALPAPPADPELLDAHGEVQDVAARGRRGAPLRDVLGGQERGRWSSIGGRDLERELARFLSGSQRKKIFLGPRQC